MKYSVTLIISALFCSTAAATPEPVTCDSPCDCHNAHGEGRWSVKTDASLPPTDASAIQAVIPSDVFTWPGPGAPKVHAGIRCLGDSSGDETRRSALVDERACQLAVFSGKLFLRARNRLRLQSNSR